MPTNYKVLGQLSPSAGVATTVYTCPSATQTIVSSIVVANTTGLTLYFRIAIRPNAETLASKHYIAYDCPVKANDSVFLTTGITMDASDVVTVYSSGNGLSFNVFGSEIS